MSVVLMTKIKINNKKIINFKVFEKYKECDIYFIVNVTNMTYILEFIILIFYQVKKNENPYTFVYMEQNINDRNKIFEKLEYLVIFLGGRTWIHKQNFKYYIK